MSRRKEQIAHAGMTMKEAIALAKRLGCDVEQKGARIRISGGALGAMAYKFAKPEKCAPKRLLVALKHAAERQRGER